MRAFLPVRMVWIWLCGLLLFGALPLWAAGPTVVIRQPTAGQVVAGPTLPLDVSFACPDGAQVLRFDAYVDSVLLVGGKMTNPIPSGNFRLKPEQEGNLVEIGVKPGAHALYVQLMDSKGNITKIKQDFIFMPVRKPEKNAPTVRIVEPKDGEKITGDNVRIRVEANDDTGVKWVMVYINDKMRLWSSEAPYVMTWNPLSEKLPNQLYTIRAKAFDFFDNEGSQSIKVLFASARAGGLTTIEADPTSDAFKPSPSPSPSVTLLQPSFGYGVTRPLYSNEMPPFTQWLADALLPDLAPSGPRSLNTGLATGGLVALLPAKALPEQSELANAGVVKLDMASAPALAALPTNTTRTLFSSGQLTPAASALLVPVDMLPKERTVSIKAPVVAAVSPGTVKETPASRTASNAVTLVGTPVFVILTGPNVATTSASSRPTAPSSAPALASGAMQTPDVRSLPAGATPGARTTAMGTPVIVMAAVVPGKGMPAITGSGTEAPVKSVQPITSSGAMTPAMSGSAITSMPSPSSVASVPTKAVPANGGQTGRSIPIARVTLEQQSQVTPGTAFTPRATEGSHGDLPTIKTTVGVPPSVETTPQPRTITSATPVVATLGVPEKAAPASTKPEEHATPLATVVTPGALQPDLRAALPAAIPTAQPPTATLHAEDSVMEIERPTTVRRGETLVAFAKAHNTTPEELVKLNPGLSPQQPLAEGAHILVPGGTAK
ncbi:MAG TPA: Ig-like domain-containing protein, partial [Armatimonadota bacterium]